MGEAQYERTLENRRGAGWSAETLQPVVPAVIERAAGALRRRRRAQDAWERIANPEWLTLAEVESVERGVVVVAVRGTAYYDVLRRQAGSLGRQLAQLAPGTSGVRFVAAGDAGQTVPKPARKPVS